MTRPLPRAARWPTALRICAVVALAPALAVATAPPAGAEPPAAAGPALVPGFVVQELPSGQDELLTDFAFLPDGSYVTTGKNGRVAWVSAAGEARTLAELPVLTRNDLGLVAVAVAPDAGTLYTGRALDVDGQWTLRLSAWTLVGGPQPTALADERVVLELPASSEAHGLTGVVAAPDGTLWVTIGDSSGYVGADPLALRALDLSTGYGKLLHVLPDGGGVPDNPFYDPADPGAWQSRVYASGFRSPFRLDLDPVTGAPVVGDVGWTAWEEVDVVRPGAVYGWPCWEGDGPTPGYAELPGCQGVPNTPPLWAYPHGPQGSSITGGFVYTGTAYPPEYQGAYFFGDYSAQRVYTLRHDAAGQLVRLPEADGFAAELGAPVAFAPHPVDGDVVWADIRGSSLARLVYAPGNRPPMARATATVDATTRTVAFDGGASADLDGDPLTHRWDLGDGAVAEGAQVVHAYEGTGTEPVTATLTVTDPGGGQDTATVTVVPGNSPPQLTLTAPLTDRRWTPGELVQASATAVDAEDGPLTVRWSELLVHCSGGLCHEHPGETFEGPEYARPFVDHGEGTRMEVAVTATDSVGVTAREVFVLQQQAAV
ncbi:PQQ-dependent sugar dehydrogenase [Geodermatophilus sabuli]|uniref:Glucose/arabinose dehydrogenase, beta-propeller fold n=1 Tax=Geodermatophilus sabuli TaxID=1564158 RepID=A0A285ED35_9ACTN|nr:PQQ-dependent sugar dehydrogenase [Geodermatophilus sabuli]MBB3083248.1 glucose/arabinose dehydrogenase [Geodermatophilus sabuli]SNX97029.1 Glucose/arabinose dehydrogenase, beta-propeller fold [Geodermatophilus sabuli]